MYLSDHQPSLRRRFESNDLDTASPSRVLTMCFDRLDRDLGTAQQAIAEHDHPVAHDALTHAQDLLGEMAEMLDVNGWEHAGSLLAVYDYLLRLLARANLLKQAPLVSEAQRLLTEIGDAFRTAAAGAASPAATAAVAASPGPASGATSLPSTPRAGAGFDTGAAPRQTAPAAGTTTLPTTGLSVRA